MAIRTGLLRPLALRQVAEGRIADRRDVAVAVGESWQAVQLAAIGRDHVPVASASVHGPPTSPGTPSRAARAPPHPADPGRSGTSCPRDRHCSSIRRREKPLGGIVDLPERRSGVPAARPTLRFRPQQRTAGCGALDPAAPGVATSPTHRPSLPNAPIDRVAVGERELALRVAVDAVDHALELVGLVQRQPVGHDRRTSSGSASWQTTQACDGVARAAVEGVGQRVRARGASPGAVADVALVVGDDDAARAATCR